ncbi:hypothetical protein A6764_07545 [Brevibacillus sp. WF146]|uniref:hypothetical protein n=1 Tax=Brevibacillus sp. WF146 TaxID=319501 RepID=UPI0007ED8B10|nr:hypothetical protein [Brevibacillus sp. WF146]UYZ14782.1 hypothetical protein A6764_07545 [Brevibacillus sp. WF146]
MEIIDFSSEKNKHAIKKGVLRRLPDCYEYCFLPDYEMKYDSFQSQSIQMLEFFFTLLELKNKTLFVSVQFPLYYDTDRIREFLEYYTFSYDEKDEKGYYVKNALEIVEGKLFKGKPLVIGRRGRKKLYYDVSAFLEVTAHYNQYHQIVHTGQAEIFPMDSLLSPTTWTTTVVPSDFTGKPIPSFRSAITWTVTLLSTSSSMKGRTAVKCA